MAVLIRITDFVPSTLIKSQEMDDELNQLVNLLSGVSTTKDTLLKFSDGANPVLRVDQLGAGVIQQWLQNGVVKTVIDNSGFLYIGKGVTDSAPISGLINGTGGSGSNIAGAALDFAGGKGTGTGVPGFVAVRYPLITASGSGLQSLSTDRFPVSVGMYTNTTPGTAVANTATETSLFTGATASPGSTLTIEAGSVRAGTALRMRFYILFGTTGTPTIQFKLKFGSVVICDSTAFNAPTGVTSGLAYIDVIVHINNISSSGLARGHMEGRIHNGLGGIVTPVFFSGPNGEPTVDFTANKAIDLTVQWGTASASNTAQLLTAYISRMRN